jgi:hypothetical protein
VSDALSADVTPIDDDEVVYRRVPPEPPFHKLDDWLTTANFKLDYRRNEQGLSVYRSCIRTLDQVLSEPSAVPNSFAVSATVGEIRRLTNGNGDPLRLDVVPCDDGGSNPGHAEIRGPAPGRLSSSANKALRDLFKKSGRLFVSR